MERVLASLSFVALLLLSFPLAHAGYVSIDEAALDAIFAQPRDKWGWAPIDVRVAPTARYADSALTSIDNDRELWHLFSLVPRGSRTVGVFFVDAIDSCGGYAPNIIGCGLQPGNALAVSSVWAASRWGPTLLAHELGHNLGLEHVPQSTPNLMNPSLSGNTALDAGQAQALYRSPLLGWDADFSQAYFSIQPIAVVASDWSAGWLAGASTSLGRAAAVPEPRSLALLLAVLAVFAVTRGVGGTRMAGTSRTSHR
jgi:hypothetical protein